MSIILGMEGIGGALGTQNSCRISCLLQGLGVLDRSELQRSFSKGRPGHKYSFSLLNLLWIPAQNRPSPWFHSRNEDSPMVEALSGG